MFMFLLIMNATIPNENSNKRLLVKKTRKGDSGFNINPNINIIEKYAIMK